jgi:hypothetical protein
MAAPELLPGMSAINNPSATDEHVRPEQKTFSDSEKEYLATFFEEYIASSASSSTKKKWVASNVYPKYIAKYNSAGPEGPNLASLLTVCVFV